MEPLKIGLKNGNLLSIREAMTIDSAKIHNFVHKISAESEFLTFGPGEFDIKEKEERDFIQSRLDSENQIYLIASIDDNIAAILNSNAGQRPRTRHSGEFSMVVKKECWGLGIGSVLMDTFIAWAKSTQIIKKINCRVRTDNHPAIRLYKRKGFVDEGIIRKEIFFNGRYYDLLWMGLEL
jgi:RimJ/RimL family protein N-acetyltransferase